MGAGTPGSLSSIVMQARPPAPATAERCRIARVPGPSDPLATVTAMSQMRRPPADPGAGLGLCRTCRSELGYPRRCRRLGNDLWELELRCPECDAVWRAQGSTREIEGFDKTLAAGRSGIKRPLPEIDRVARGGEARP